MKFSKSHTFVLVAFATRNPKLAEQCFWVYFSQFGTSPQALANMTWNKARLKNYLWLYWKRLLILCMQPEWPRHFPLTKCHKAKGGSKGAQRMEYSGKAHKWDNSSYRRHLKLGSETALVMVYEPTVGQYWFFVCDVEMQMSLVLSTLQCSAGEGGVRAKVVADNWPQAKSCSHILIVIK